MYVLYAKEKKPEEKADEKTKEGNSNPPPKPIRLQNGVRFSKEKPQPCEVTKV